MKYLLDTHAIIWYFEDSLKLPKRIAELIDDPKADIYVCSVSLWEIVIKMNLGKLDLQLPLNELLSRLKSGAFNILQIEDAHLKGLLDLPFVHKDPFDRLIVSSALVEDLTVITIDENIQKYDVSWTW